jgi:formylglycine-generating enzyme
MGRARAGGRASGRPAGSNKNMTIPKRIVPTTAVRAARRLLAVGLCPLLLVIACDAPPAQPTRPDPFRLLKKKQKTAKKVTPFDLPVSTAEAPVSPASATAAEPTGVVQPPSTPPGDASATKADSESESDEKETAVGSCPAEMVLVEGNACVGDVKQTCLSWLDTDSGEPPKRCANFSMDVTCLGERKPLRFCIDKWEYTNTPDEPPLSNVSWTVSRDMCRSMGKRLCTETEWVFACEGEDMLPYPTGYSRDATKCNFDQMELVDKRGKMRDLRRLGREMPKCASPFGVMNMVGNVDEWAEREKAWTPWRASLKGGWWLAARNRCRPATTGHDEFFFEVQTGFRCCQEAEPAR